MSAPGRPEIRPGVLLADSFGNLYQVQHRVDRDPRWKVPGWRVLKLYTQFGDSHSMTEFLAGYLTDGHTVVTLDEWTPVLGGGVEARWVHDAESGRFVRELRRI